MKGVRAGPLPLDKLRMRTRDTWRVRATSTGRGPQGSRWTHSAGQRAGRRTLFGCVLKLAASGNVRRVGRRARLTPSCALDSGFSVTLS